MELLNPGVDAEYKRWKTIIGANDEFHSEDTIGLHEVLAAHFLMIDYFAEKNYGIGGIGPRNLNLLHSALSRQFTEFGGVKKWSGLYEVAATLMFGLIVNHPFHDANKRTALLATLSLLGRKKRVIALPQKRLDALVVAIAADELHKYFGKDARYQERLQSLAGPKDTDGKVRIIANFLQRNTRARDDSARALTFSDLNRVLRNHGFELRNPNGNYINVVRVEPAKPGGFLGIGARPEREVFLTQIGFPGWKDQVHKATLKEVRQATHLTSQEGCDSKVFYEGAEPLSTLISEYAEPLKRLANK